MQIWVADAITLVAAVHGLLSLSSSFYSQVAAVITAVVAEITIAVAVADFLTAGEPMHLVHRLFFDVIYFYKFTIAYF